MTKQDTEPTINKQGYWVTSNLDFDGPRTYACANLKALDQLIRHLTGHEGSTFPSDNRNLPQVPGIYIAYPLHIWEGTK